MEKKLKIIFIALFFSVSLIPLVLMPLSGNQEAESSAAEVTFPKTVSAGFMQQAGDYFSKKFAFRREMVTLGNLIKAKVFRISGQEEVVLGKDGYLFYRDSFDDFLGRNSLTDYQIGSMAYNIKLMEDELTGKGIEFIFTVAPNKNSLYPELMPGKYRPDVYNRNIRMLRPLLRRDGVRYLNLYRLFKDLPETMYLKGDSHWNNTGAALVTGEIISALERKRYAFDDGRSEVRKDFPGDLTAMLYPAGGEPDEQVYYDKMAGEVYNDRVSVKIVDETTGDMKEIDPAEEPDWPKASEIETSSLEHRDGSLLMIRDSFGNSLTPFLAEEFEKALFLNGTPYDIGRAADEGYDMVVFETVERNLDRLISDAPVISTTDAGLTEDIKAGLDGLLAGAGEYEGSLTMELSDSEFDYTYVRGELDPAKTGPDSRIYLVMKDRETGATGYRALFRVNRAGAEGFEEEDPGQYGCAAYIKTEDIPGGEYDLYLAYENDGEWDVSGKLGSYISEE